MVLIVDDKSENIFSLKTILELHSFPTDTALSGEEALKKILKNSYALIILDVQMPGMDGFEVAEAISGYSKGRDIPIIFLSAANTDKKFITKGYTSGGIDYITKPIDPDILLLKVKTFYRLYEQNRELNRIQADLRSEIEFRKKVEDELQEAMKNKDEFISIASHELKTPLTTIKAYVQLLDRSIAGPGSNKMFVERALVQVNKLDSLIMDLLDISRIESGKLKFNKKVFNFEGMLSNAAETIRQTYPDYRIIRKGQASIGVFGDEMRLEQVIINYLTNAVKYSPDNKEVYIETSIGPDNNLIVLIRDFGIGISKDQQSDIFSKFYRVEESANQFQGLGIGLYICAEIIRRHDGQYGVESEPGKGSTFYFSIPLNNYPNL
ncbi:MAG: hybrid sensor histidine kinase/response regulator [Bacteroidota bacterium]|nr:hybrid sensor histidine kinase/response regulator [Bacteroidota bacterium]MDP4217213.1 hybrid sensor histidine kinase/response regulator [Bacteroidota bacterium]MDP4254567.1 hybrid sensor histidine kinase/response regulator [Bacteroidota bacterium]MDP4257368.1 hybrid sensor histidine kinase/response regulator [Bacteroidota bacterium]